VGNGGPTDTGLDPEIRNTIVSGPALGSGPSHAVVFEDVEGGFVWNCEHISAHAAAAIPAQSYVWSWATSGVADRVRGPKFHSCRAEFTNGEGADAEGVRVAVSGLNQDLEYVWGTEIHDCQVQFTPNGAPGAITKVGFVIANAVTGTAVTDIEDTSIDNCKALNAHRGIVIDGTGGGNGRIVSVRVQSCQARRTLNTGSATARGMIIRGGSGTTNPNILDVGVQNCDFSLTAAAAAAIGLEITNAFVDDTIVLGNNLKSLTGTAITAITDNGTNTEAAHNILV
jgi:hypothetical protein